ncbi:MULTISPECIES: nucleoside hydrolase [unclassified Oceanispirochaeta]|uniref:nucleoside hydrolase n=1 Tax=unclassified Oceanispirochaeta TaxID=2635722 RepID=UPI000E08F12B|nr:MULTISPECIES: nucleoside hydrolase [unclassified Oceanispirochaeta]MBF9016762.1 nucleoside hydrolase [Oceanispirochaeta sp. M2]RDG32476.1 nucleoside hydrolase [Oceanispirochaeta sp. M1]
MLKRQIVIDCDPGIDDALALMMAFASDKLNVRAITTVAGNVSVENTARNALDLAALAGVDIEVAAGAAKPLYVPPKHAESVHGANGLGGVVLPKGKSLSSRSAVDLLRDEAGKAAGELEIIALGPLTNIAELLMVYPDTAKQIKSIIMMGGAVNGGNATPAAEFNFYADPHAAAVVFRSGVPLFMYGLDVTNRALLYPEEVRNMEQLGGPVIESLTGMMEWYMDFYRSIGHPGLGMHDPFAVACAIDPSLAGMESYHVEIETEGSLTRGKSVADVLKVTGKKPNAQVAMTLDRERFVKLFMDLMRTYA